MSGLGGCLLCMQIKVLKICLLWKTQKTKNDFGFLQEVFIQYAQKMGYYFSNPKLVLYERLLKLHLQKWMPHSIMLSCS
jgi:hypothetical protein